MLPVNKYRPIAMSPLRKSQGKRGSSGYFTTSVVITRLFNLILALFFGGLALPVIGALVPLVWAVNGWPVFYSGVRLGLKKRPFVMYKFRTLPLDFEKEYDAHLVSYQHGYTLPWFCRFMRDTRLDELPQLFNVLKGDMDFIGPRPVRPAVYRKICRGIRAYDRRFLVKPGLVGYSQLFTPHSTPKRIRSFIDNRASRYKKNLAFDLFIICLAGCGVVQKTVKMLSHILCLLFMDKVFKRYSNRRGLDRIRQERGKVFFCDPEQDYIHCCLSHGREPDGMLVDMNEKHMRVDTNVAIGEDQKMVIRGAALVKTKVGRKETKSFFCSVRMFKVHEDPIGRLAHTYIFEYEPASDLNRYFVDQYFLKKSLMRYVI
jgi:lipopolysaccharide/colanic/teichoic acid biosynthesis glycosyltransferase